MDNKTPHQSSGENRELPEAQTQKHKILKALDRAARSKIARTSFVVSAAVADLLGNESTAEAKPPHRPAIHSVHVVKPKVNYQRFSNSPVKLKIIEGAELAALEGTPEIAGKFNPLKKGDMPEIQAQCEFYDVWHSGIPLVKIRPEDLEKQVSPHFKLKEFVRIDPNWLHVVKPGGYQKYKGEYYRTIARVDPEIIKTVEEIVVEMEKDANKKRKKGSPRIRINFHVDEAYRPYGENARTYVWKNEHRKPGTDPESHPRSRHTSGRGVDIDLIPGIEAAADRVLTRRGTGGLGTHGASIVHVDCRPEKYAKPWHYNKQKKGSVSILEKAQAKQDAAQKPTQKPAPKSIAKGTNPLITDTPEARAQLESCTGIEQLIADKIIPAHLVKGSLHYGESDENLWKKKMRLIGNQRYKWEVIVDKLERQKSKFLKKHHKEKVPKGLTDSLNHANNRLEHYANQYVAAEKAQKSVLDAPSGPDYAKTDYRRMIKRVLEKWVPKLANTNFKPYLAYLNNPDTYHALHVQEIIPVGYKNGKKWVKFTDAARVQLYRLFTMYRDPAKMPALNDAEASFGIGQTTADTYETLLNQDGAKKIFKLPNFEECTGFDCQMRRDILNMAHNLKLLDKYVFEKHPHLKKLLDDATLDEQNLFLSTLIGAMHNGGPGIMAGAEAGAGKKLDTVKTLEEGGNLLLQHCKSSDVRRYGRHVRDLYVHLTTLKNKGGTVTREVPEKGRHGAIEEPPKRVQKPGKKEGQKPPRKEIKKAPAIEDDEETPIEFPRAAPAPVRQQDVPRGAPAPVNQQDGPRGAPAPVNQEDGPRGAPAPAYEAPRKKSIRDIGAETLGKIKNVFKRR